MKSSLNKDSAIDFPTDYPIKAMTAATEDALAILMQILDAQHASYDAKNNKLVTSKNGKYKSATATIVATSKQQLDAIYQQLTDHPKVLMAL